MKIINVSNNEKLKIHPMSLDEFDNNEFLKHPIYSIYEKKKLKTGDLCTLALLDSKVGVVILENDNIDASIYGLERLNGSSFIMFYNSSKYHIVWTYLKLFGYDEHLKYTSDKNYSIAKVMPNAIDIETLKDKKKLAVQIEEYSKYLK